MAAALDAEHRQLVINITADNDKPVPKDSLEFLGDIATNGTDGEQRDLCVLLAQRLDEPSISVKLKVLRVVTVLSNKGGNSFAAHLRRNARDVMRAHTEFEAPIDPVHGEKPKLMIRAISSKCLRQIEEQAAACPSQPQPQPAPAQVPVSAPSPTGAPADPLVSMRQLLAEAVANLDGKIAATTTEMDTRCENLEQWVGEVEERVISTVKAASQPSDSGSRTEAHEKRLLALESQLSGLHASGGGAGQASVVAVAEGLSSVQAAVGELDAKLAQLHAQLGSLETTQVETARTAAVSLDGLRSELAQTASAVAAGVGPRVVSLEAQLAQISASTTGDTPATETVLPAIATLEAKLATLETSQSKSSESAAVAIRDLQSAVRQLAVASSAGDGVAAESAERHAQGVSGGSGDDDDAEAAAQQLGARVEDCIRRKLEEFRGLRVGDYCEVATDSCQGRGVVAFTGQTAFKDGAWVGVRLDQPLGKNNGAVQGQRYFTCQEGHGVFVPPDRVRRITASEAVAGALALEREAQSAAVERLRDECKQYQEACNTTVGSMEASWGGRCSSVEELLRELDGRTQDHGETLRAAQQQLEGLSDRVDRDLQAGMIQRFEGAMDAAKAELAKQVTEMQGRFTDMESCIAAVKPGPLGAQVESVVARQLDAHSTRLGDVERGLNASLVQMQSELVATAKSVKELTADSGAQDIHDMVEQRIQALAEQSQAQLAEVDKRLTASACSKLDFDAGQDAYEKRIDALESWLLQVEEKTSSSDKAVGSRLDAMASDVQMSLTATKENLNGTLRKLASGVKAQIDSVEAKVLGILKQHTELFDEKLRLTVGRGEFDEFVANVSGRTLALEESIQATLEEASTRASATQETVVQLQKQWSDAHHHAEKKQEPLTIRVPDVQIRHNTDGGGSQSKPYVVYQFDVRVAGNSHSFYVRWSACESFHKAITKDMKLPKGAEFKSEFPKKLKKTLEPAKLESRRVELDALFGDLSEWGRENGMAVLNLPVVRQFLFQPGDQPPPPVPEAAQQPEPSPA